MTKFHPVIYNIAKHIKRTAFCLDDGKKPFEVVKLELLAFLVLQSYMNVADKINGRHIPVFMSSFHKNRAASAAWSRMASASAWEKVWPHSPPNCQVPSPMAETRKPVLPRIR